MCALGLRERRVPAIIQAFALMLAPDSTRNLNVLVDNNISNLNARASFVRCKKEEDATTFLRILIEAAPLISGGRLAAPGERLSRSPSAAARSLR